MISFIFAMDRNRVIGANNTLPWRLPADMAFFRRTTTGHPILMGRKTFLSIGSKPLPKRENWVMTRDPEFAAEKCVVLHTVEEVLERAQTADELFVIGGEEIFRLLLPYADRLYITEIDHDFEGDTFFPPINEEEWRVQWQKEGMVDEQNRYPHVFKLLERIK